MLDDQNQIYIQYLVYLFHHDKICNHFPTFPYQTYKFLIILQYLKISKNNSQHTGSFFRIPQLFEVWNNEIPNLFQILNPMRTQCHYSGSQISVYEYCGVGRLGVTDKRAYVCVCCGVGRLGVADKFVLWGKELESQINLCVYVYYGVGLAATDKYVYVCVVGWGRDWSHR